MSGRKQKRPRRNPLISVVIPAWNEEKYIGRALKALLNQSLPREEYEIIVVDGNSTDRTVKIARRQADRVFINVGSTVSSARNYGARKARGEILAFLDADSVPRRDWLEHIKRAIVLDKYSGVGGDTEVLERDLEGEEFYKALNFVQKALSDLGAYHFSGYNCAYRKKQFLKLGGFDSRFKVSEDTDLSLRFGKKFRCKYLPELVVKTSYRRIKQLGAFRVVFMWMLGHYYISVNKPFPWDYGSMIKK